MACAHDKLNAFLERYLKLYCKHLVAVNQIFASLVPWTEHKAVQ